MNGKGCVLPILGLLLAFQPALDASAPFPIGALTGNGQERVNGVPSGAVLYSGNRIATSSSNTASIHLRKDDALALGPSTDVRITANGNGFMVLLHRGKVAAIGRPEAPIIISAGGVTVAPGQASGLYEVALRGDELKVWTRRGVTEVKGAGRTVEVGAGSLMKASLTQKRSFQESRKILMVTMVAAAGMGIDAGSHQTTCVSPSQLTCP
ncbi:MAG TPA: hypothetical protein VNJ12_04515 [Candidatus Dormibacteraeota bacterium]|nr:hypothetical protein [Candidatus Dormibacteraeota bacterium]